MKDLFGYDQSAGCMHTYTKSLRKHRGIGGDDGWYPSLSIVRESSEGISSPTCRNTIDYPRYTAPDHSPQVRAILSSTIRRSNTRLQAPRANTQHQKQQSHQRPLTSCSVFTGTACLLHSADRPHRPRLLACPRKASAPFEPIPLLAFPAPPHRPRY